MVLVPLGLLAGCKLVDQRTFAPAPEAKPAAPAPVAQAQVDTRTPLVTIGYAQNSPNYEEMLRYAVRAAETRVPGVHYDVIAILPADGDAATAQRRAADVMRGIMAQNVPADHIHLGLRNEPAGSPPQVRVYVR